MNGMEEVLESGSPDRVIEHLRQCRRNGAAVSVEDMRCAQDVVLEKGTPEHWVCFAREFRAPDVGAVLRAVEDRGDVDDVQAMRDAVGIGPKRREVLGNRVREYGMLVAERGSPQEIRDYLLDIGDVTREMCGAMERRLLEVGDLASCVAFLSVAGRGRLENPEAVARRAMESAGSAPNPLLVHDAKPLLVRAGVPGDEVEEWADRVAPTLSAPGV